MTTRLQQEKIDAILALGKNSVTTDDLLGIYKSNNGQYVRAAYRRLAREYGLPPIENNIKVRAGKDIMDSEMPERVRETTKDVYSSGLQVMNVRKLIDGRIAYEVK